MKLFFRALGMYITILVLVACGATEEDGQEDQTESVLQVYTTLYPLEYFTNEIGGEYVSVSSVLPPGSDAHTFEPTSRMMVEIAEADLFIFNDREMEAFAPQIQEALNNESVSFLEASANLEKMLYNHGHEDEDDHSHDHDHEDEGDHSHDHGHEDEGDHSHDHGHEDEGDHSHDHGHEDEGDHSHDHNHESDDDHNHDHDYEGEEDHSDNHADDDHDHGEYDPHVWLSPRLSIQLAEEILTAIIKLMPEQEAYFTSQFNTLADKLTELDEKFSEAINKYENKKILVTHAAYGYWERDYGIEQIAITGISPTDEPSQRKLTEILDLIENSSINHVIFEQNIQPRVASVIQDEAGLTSLQFHNLEVLTQIDIDNEDDYFTLMNHNISVLEEALQ